MKKLPIAINDFSIIRNNNYLYVDKSDALADLASNWSPFFLSRPFGFGKTLLLSTLISLFSGKTELFKGLAAEECASQFHDNPFPIIAFNLSNFSTNNSEKFEESLLNKITSLADSFSIQCTSKACDEALNDLINNIFSSYGYIVVLIANYEQPISSCITSIKNLIEIRKRVKTFYEVLESNTKNFRFLLITGSETYEKTGVFSTFQKIDNISNIVDFSNLTGFTQKEIEYNFYQWIENNAKRLSIPANTYFNELLSSCQTYSFDGKNNLYNPLALMTCLRQCSLAEYTSTIHSNLSSKFFTCLNPGDSAFLDISNSPFYIDKTELLTYTNRFINTKQKYICISRPRRFGKTTTVNMISSYYDRTARASVTFSKFKIKSDKSFLIHANKYIVIKINIQTFLSQTHDINKLIESIKSAIYNDLIIQYDFEYSSLDINEFMKNISLKTGIKFVITIDEWDCIFREFRENKEWQEKYFDFLRYFFKDQEHIALVYMTGILPIKKYGTHSALNMFNEFSMLNAKPFTEFVGFTENEVKKLCKSFYRDFNQCKVWYDGYTIDTHFSIYNPKSVIEYIIRGVFDTYWNNTETYEALQIYITMDYYGLKETIIKLLSNDYEKINTKTFTNDMRTFTSQDDVLTLLVHLGYLSYNTSNQTIHIPNKEISYEFVSAIQNKGWPKVVQAIKQSENLLKAVLAKDHEAVAKGIEAVHLETSILTYNDENALAYTISLAFYAAREMYTIVREFPTGKGFADCVFLPREKNRYPILCIELKWNKSANSAITQILEKNYPASLLDQSGSVILVGINYDTKSKKHTCSIQSITL
ncbi:MAG: AAA family ATPase [Desulfovibrio sp.]|nr:AAA family ATPase [Desulfovibrio sp.]